MGIRSRDSEFKDFYFAESERLRRLALFLTGKPEQASDLAQEALLRTYQAWHRIRGDAGAYSRRTMINLYRNSVRRLMVERKYRPSPAPEAQPAHASIEEALRVAEALRTLPPVRRAVVLLRFYEDMSEAQIAHVLDRPVGTIKSDLHRALKTLRPLLENDVKEPA